MAIGFQRPRPGVEFDASTGKLYVFKARSITVLRPWPQLLAWRKTHEQPFWMHVRPPLKELPTGSVTERIQSCLNRVNLLEHMDPRALSDIPAQEAERICELTGFRFDADTWDS